jgi:hypothetical protein
MELAQGYMKRHSLFTDLL